MSSSVSKSTTSATLGTVLFTAAVASMSTLALSYWCHCRRLQTLTAKLEEVRQAERVGRIRAEVKLRAALKRQQASATTSSASASTTLDDDDNSDDPFSQSHNNDNDHNNMMTLKCIGTIISPYTKRMGTPRQGALVPSSRGILQFCSNSNSMRIAMESVEGLERYSHAWILFGFHANTNIIAKKSKVRPPRAPVKVGQLATRSPHRPNPLGLSLVRVHSVHHKERRLYVRALDLVHGTPVYDVKPCVPWDIPGRYDRGGGEEGQLRVPEWVEQEDALSGVDFTAEAEEDLREAVASGQLAPLYTAHNDGYEGALQTLQQVLAQDPRASNKRGTSTKANEATYKIHFGRTQVEFVVDDSEMVHVVRVKPVEFSEAAHVDGIPLASESTLTL